MDIDYHLEKPTLAVDVVVFREWNNHLQVLLVRREQAPFADAFAIPGVALRANELLKDAVFRALSIKAGFSDSLFSSLYLEQLATFDELYRDPRGRTLSVVYLALCRQAIEEHVHWQEVDHLQKGDLPFDHFDLILAARQRLQGKLRYTNIASFLMAEQFKVDDLRALYESILQVQLNRSNFRSKLVKIKLIEQAEKAAARVSRRGGRPAHLYRFTSQHLQHLDDFI